MILSGWAQQSSSAVGFAGGMDQLSWSIAGNLKGESPNVYSELEWSGVIGAGVWMDQYLPVHKQLGLSLEGEQLWFFAGEVTDTDYGSDNRTNPIFHTSLTASKGFSNQLTPMLGYELLHQPRWRVQGLLGYQLVTKKFYLMDDSNLRSTYQANWMGPSAKLALSWHHKLIILQWSIQYSQVRYRAKANWNLIDEFEHPVSFRHEAKGFVARKSLALLIPIGQCWQLKSQIGYSYASTGKGIDTLYKSDGTRPRTQLNDVTNESLSISFGVVVKWK